jgi:hypothetical protein
MKLPLFTDSSLAISNFLENCGNLSTGLKSSRRFAVSGWWLCPAREPGYLVAT